MKRFTSLMVAGFFSLAVPLCNPEKSMAQVTPVLTGSSTSAKPVDYGSLDQSVQDVLRFYQATPDAHYGDFTFHLESNFFPNENKVAFDLKAEYHGKGEYSDKMNLIYMVCGAFDRGEGWRSMCFPPPNYRAIPEPEKKSLQPGEIFHQAVEITYSPERLSGVKYLVPHVDIFFKDTDEPQARVGVFLQK